MLPTYQKFNLQSMLILYEYFQQFLQTSKQCCARHCVSDKFGKRVVKLLVTDLATFFVQ